MPISNAAFVRSTLLLLVAGVVALLAIVGTSLWLVGRVQAHFADLVEVRAARSAAADFLSNLQDAESGQRGFVITADPIFREPYDRALLALAERQKDLFRTVEPFPATRTGCRSSSASSRASSPSSPRR